MVNFSYKAGGCLKLPGVDSSSTVVQRGQEGNESFKMVVVVALKNSTGVGQNRPWKMGGRTGLCGVDRLKRKGMRFSLSFMIG
ncbi:S2-RNase [Pyrus ussuriensis x Pyrus communis]|uniref:S2-RNase n=1 Tax=Pyrus ussuriensis x Pyrus communis TaxID=2448454 RepID=A0A5N5HAS7_9ROSA|nr:S2-RNase [Pyrus ussuriensis x Pyrus communis]